jgi:hypothetical protein
MHIAVSHLVNLIIPRLLGRPFNKCPGLFLGFILLIDFIGIFLIKLEMRFQTTGVPTLIFDSALTS